MRVRFTVAIVLVLVFFVFGCGGVPRESIVGFYTLSSPAGSIELELFDDGSFNETIRLVSQPAISRRGEWDGPTSRYSQIGLYGLWIPQEFSPDYIVRADRTNKDGIEYSEPGYWVVQPYYYFGKVMIPIYPDSDVKFEQTRSRQSFR